MAAAASAASVSEAKFNVLKREFVDFVGAKKTKWIQENNHRPNIWVLYETDPHERERVAGVIRAWERYITPIAEAWWRERGFETVWPADSSDPPEYYPLGSEPD